MKTFKKFLKWVFIPLVLLIGGFGIFVGVKQNKTYNVAYPDLQATTDSATIAD